MGYCCRIFTPVQPVYPAASLRDFLSGAYSRRSEVRWPAGFALNEEMQFAARLGIDADAEFEAWRDDCAAHDRRYTDWRAA